MTGPRLVLFDVDATLITTGGVGKAAMLDAARELHGPAFTIDGISFAGRLDPLLLEEMLRLNGLHDGPDAVEAVYAAYRHALKKRLESPIRGGSLPGVMDLLGQLEQTEGVVLGLLTGNFGDTGSMKLRACGIEPDRFPIRVWGGDSPHKPPSRDHLPAVGRDRFRATFGRPIEPDRVTVIGDTPLDVRCALVNGCRALGVGTGQYPVADLLHAGAHHAVANLTDTGSIVRWLIEAP